VEKLRKEAKKRLVTCCVSNIVTTKSDSDSTSNFVSLSFAEFQMTDVITLGLDNEVGH